MISELPIESVHGRSEWNWNERRAARETSRAPDSGTDRRRKRCDKGGSSDRAAATRREIERLEAELERKEQQLRRVTERYELLLEEKNKQLAKRDGSECERKPRSTVRSVVVRYVSGRR